MHIELVQAWDEEQMISWNLLENILSLGLRLLDFMGPTGANLYEAVL